VVASLTLYCVGLGISNAALFRLALFASDDGKGLVSATIGMLSIAVMGAGGLVIAANGGGNRLEHFALWAAFGGLLCLPFLYGFLKGTDTPGTQSR
jgi:DHA1 family multidrug/chloramphenicol efflux transport protein-like MFS transporter